ncbi:MAG: LysM peptidoglycan-binding domain-containing protein [Candidatus Thiodiazotropha sp. (ex Dulcina madagascariensis)]|nr:LysM peptidoglycan-binding domain-containing protein [Candidatus Thiodiazotropha sp. (ex Dulcina madagascariensis)]
MKDVKKIKKEVKKDTPNFVKILIITVITLSLSACEGLGPRQQPEPVVTEEPKEEVVETIPPPTDSLTPSQRVRKALQQLEQGDYDNAHNQLTWALQEKPTLQIATNLLEQMDADPIEYLGLKNFFYDVEPGDSLSIIAKKFLKDPLKFVILARYNKLENPSKLAPGQRIRVPGERPVIKKRKPKPKPKTTAQEPPLATQPMAETPETPSIEPEVTEKPTETTPDLLIEEASVTPQAIVEEKPVEARPATVDEILSSAKGLRSEGDLGAAIYLLESEGSHHPQSKKIPSLLAGYYNEHADQLISQGKLDDARSILEKLIILDSDEAAINKLILVEDKIEAQKLFQNAQDQQNVGKFEEAYQTYTQVLTYDPDNAEAKEAQLAVRDRLTDGYHRQAMQLFRRQELDEAIGFWDKILELNPNHSLAPGYKARALEMKQKLQKIGPGG